MAYVRKTVRTDDVVRGQSHRANPKNPTTAHCTFWLSPEQLDDAHEHHLNLGHELIGEVDCACGNHTRRRYRPT